ncbi:MAG: hypothetical protein KC877_04320, partial [Candidatus Kaiserbacteria bacterium]|nr:hypothetical protein [Candidatus Kaiserbacteria bacterium]
GWTRLILVSLVVTYFYSVAFMIDGFRADRDVVLLFSFIFVSMYFAANMVSLVRRHVEGVKHMLTHTLVALGTAIFLFTWIEVAVDAEWKSILYVAWAMIFAVGTYIVYSFTANKPAFYLYGATAAALIGVATAAELDGPVLTLAYLFEICVLLLAAGRLGLRARTLSRMSLLLTVPVLLSLESFGSSAWRQGVFHEDFVVLGLTMFVLGTIGLLLHAKSAEAEDEVALITAQGHLAVSGLYATALVWLILHAAVASDDLATMLSLIIYTVVGIGLFVAGTARSIDWQRLVGSILIGFVVLRLLFVEVWDMNLEGRIITFLIIGVLLISTAFLHKNRKQTDDVIVSE